MHSYLLCRVNLACLKISGINPHEKMSIDWLLHVDLCASLHCLAWRDALRLIPTGTIGELQFTDE